jgi:maleylpyruvate isomerase
MQQINYVRDATRRMLAGLDWLTDADVARASLCPGWTVGHVLTHIARNADALRRGIDGARRGEPVMLYDSMEARAADIEAGAARPIAELAADIGKSALLLDDVWSALDGETWEGEVLHRLGPRSVRGTPAMRWREVEIHRADLACGYGPAEWPEPFAAHLLDETGTSVAARLPTGLAVELRATDMDRRWSLGPADGRRITVSGPSWAIAAWMVGRQAAAPGSLSAAGADLPELAPWL